MTNVSRLIRRLSLVAFCTAGVVLAAAYGFAFVQSIRAQDAVTALLDSAGPRVNERRNIMKDGEVISSYSNAPLAFLKLSPFKAVYTSVSYRSGRDVERSIQFFQAPRTSVSLKIASSTDGSCHKDWQPLAVHREGPTVMVVVECGDKMPHGIELDVSCMRWLSPCGKVMDSPE